MKKPRVGVCMFCDRTGPLSDEDVFPKWLGRRLHKREGAKRYGMSTFTFNDAGEPLVDDDGQFIVSSRRQTGNLPLPFKLPNICSDCNNGWMSQLESRAIPVMTPLMDGESTNFEVVSQDVLAIWALKTSLTYNAVVTPGVIPLEAGAHPLYTAQTPIPNSRVVVGTAPTMDYFHFRNVERPILPGGLQIGVVTTGFQFDHLVVQTLIVWPAQVGVGLAQQASPAEMGGLVQIWPSVGPIAWPQPFLPPTKKAQPPKQSS